MTTKVDIAPPFHNDLRRLAKKYPAVIRQFETLLRQLQADERPGDKIPGVGYDVYKVRLANPSAQRGKSGGFRVIYYVQMTEQADMSAEEIRRIAEAVLLPNPTPNSGTNSPPMAVNVMLTPVLRIANSRRF